jgi:hypothetical protein
MNSNSIRSTRQRHASSGSSRRLKSPLAAPDGSGDSRPPSDDDMEAIAVAPQMPLDDRAATMAEFEGYLRTVTNREKRP